MYSISIPGLVHDDLGVENDGKHLKEYGLSTAAATRTLVIVEILLTVVVQSASCFDRRVQVEYHKLFPQYGTKNPVGNMSVGWVSFTVIPGFSSCLQ